MLQSQTVYQPELNKNNVFLRPTTSLKSLPSNKDAFRLANGICRLLYPQQNQPRYTTDKLNTSDITGVTRKTRRSIVVKKEEVEGARPRTLKQNLGLVKPILNLRTDDINLGSPRIINLRRLTEHTTSHAAHRYQYNLENINERYSPERQITTTLHC